MKGGPKRGAYVEYASMDEEVAMVKGTSGHVSAISIGNAVSSTQEFRASAFIIIYLFNVVKSCYCFFVLLLFKVPHFCIFY